MRWIFEDDEHFLRSLGIKPWPDYDYYQENIMEDRMNEIYENYQSDDSTYPEIELSSFETITPSIQLPEMDEADYQREVRQSLASDIQQFLSFSTPKDLLNFITLYI